MIKELICFIGIAIFFSAGIYYAALEHHEERLEIEMIKSRIKDLENSTCHK